MVTTIEDSWGCSVDFEEDWSEWRINDIYEGKQAYVKGIQESWYISKIQQEDNILHLNSNTHEEIRKILSNGEACTITFSPIPPVT